jgi:hypothetical protein
LGGQAVAAGGFEAMAKDLRDGNDVLAVADHRCCGGLSQDGGG